MGKKIIFLIVIMLILSTSIGLISSKKITSESLIEEIYAPEYSHTVFSGIALTQGCGSCHAWNQNIYDAYISGDYDFEYSSMIVYDEDGYILIQKAYEWEKNYGITSYPTSIFDGDYERIVGYYPDEIPDTLNVCGNRTVANITANITLSWLGNATIRVNISIQNNEIIQYAGHIKTFITEIISRYNTSQGDPFHFGFLDFAFDENISINPGETYINSTIWNGNEHADEHGDDFGDITPHNIKVTLTIYNNNNSYVDETVSTRITSNNPPNTPSDPIPGNGAIDVPFDTNLRWMGGDPDGDPVTYDVYFGTISPPPLVSSNQSDTLYLAYKLEFNTIYFWKIVAWDNYGEYMEGPIWSFTTEELFIPDLKANGTLSWSGVKPGETINGFFTVENIGKSGSLLDWKILTWPSWGSWTFTKSSGNDLESGDVETIGITIVVPDEKNGNFNGNLLIINIENGSDFDIIEISIATSMKHSSSYSPFLKFLQKFVCSFPQFKQFLSLFPFFNNILNL